MKKIVKVSMSFSPDGRSKVNTVQNVGGLRDKNGTLVCEKVANELAAAVGGKIDESSHKETVDLYDATSSESATEVQAGL